MHPSKARLHLDPGLITMGALVVGAPHLLGGVHAASTMFLAVAACAVLAWTLWTNRRSEKQAIGFEPVAILLLLMLAATSLHALPFNVWIMGKLSPASLAHANATATGLGAPPPGSVPFSLDPGGTHERILYGIVVFAAFCAARMSARSTRRTTLLMAVAASAILIAVSDLLHRLFAATEVYGLYVPEAVPRASPLLNPNNLAGFLALGLPVCLGVAAESRPGPRWVWLLGAAVVAATNLLTGSRGGMIALIGGATLFGALYWIRPRSSSRRRRANSKENSKASGPTPTSRSMTGAVLTILSLMLAGLFATMAADDFVDTDYENLSKLELYQVGWQVLIQSPERALLGVGRGAFSAGFSELNPWSGRALHAESIPIQYAVEFGLPLALLFIGGATLRMGTALRSWRSPAQLGGLSGLSAIGLQNLLDFGLELSGIALPAAVCLAAVLPRVQSSSHAWLRHTGLRATSLTGLIASVVLLAVYGPSAVSNDSLIVHARLLELHRSQDNEAFWGPFSRSATAHPADPVLALLAAGQRLKENHRDAPFWINRTMDLAPGWGGPHILAAHWLASKGRRGQALGELRLAVERDPERSLSELCSWIEQTPTAQTVLALTPASGTSRARALDIGGRCLGKAPSEAEKIDALLLGEVPGHIDATLRQTQRDIAAKRWSEAIARARVLQSVAPTLAEPYQLEAQALIAQGEPQAASQRLAAALPRTSDRRSVLIHLASAYTSAKDAEGMRRTIEQLRMVSAGNTDGLARSAALLSHCESQLSNHARALKAIREAYSLLPLPEFLETAASLAAHLGQTDFAMSAWEELCAKHPDHPSYCSARDALRETRATP